MRYVVRGGCSLTSFLRMRLARSISVTPTILRILSVPIRARADSGSSPCRFGSPCRVIRGGRSLVGVRGAAAWISSRSNLASGPKAVGGRGDPDRAPESMPMRRLDRFPRDLRVDRLTLAASATSAAAASTAAFAVASSTVAACIVRSLSLVPLHAETDDQQQRHLCQQICQQWQALPEPHALFLAKHSECRRVLLPHVRHSLSHQEGRKEYTYRRNKKDEVAHTFGAARLTKVRFRSSECLK